MLRKEGRRRFIKKSRRKLRTVGQLWWIIVPGLVMIAVGAVLLERYHSSDSMFAKLAGLFVSELGFACLISAIIFAVMEEWSAREHGKTAIGHLYGVRPVGYFFSKIERHVLKQAFYRDKVIVTYAFEEKKGEALLVRCHVEYVVTNMCTHDDEDGFLVRGGVTTKPLLHIGPTDWEDMLGVREVKVDGHPIAVKTVEDPVKRTQTYQAVEKTRLTFGKSVRVEATHYLVKHDHDTAVWSTALPSRRVKLVLEWRPELDLNVVADVIHPDAGQPEPRHGPNSLTLAVDEPFLIGHGFHFWWSPKGTQGAAPTSAEAGPAAENAP